jgi:cytoskeletal protein RodZ
LVTNKRIPDIRGEVLKKAREAKGLSVSELATKACFSVKQIEQLENGEKSHFYTLAIKVNAAKRIADELGIKHEEIFDFGPDLVEESRETISRSDINEPSSEPLVLEADKEPSVVQSERKVEQLERFPEPSQPEKRKTGRPYFLGVAIVALVVIVILNLQPSTEIAKSTEVAKLPSETINNSAEPKKEDPAATPSSSSGSAAIPAQAVAASPVPVATAVDGCPALDTNSPAYRSPIATKAGNMVYVQTRSAQTICVKDATGKLEKRSLDQGGSHSFYGKAPFVLMTSGLGQTDIFFQGYKVRVENPNSKSIVLEEVAF